MTSEKKIEVAAKLIEARDAMKRLLGPSGWAQGVGTWRPAIEARMKSMNTDNVLATVLPVAQEMSAAGQAPAMLLAVACEMIAPSESESTQSTQ